MVGKASGRSHPHTGPFSPRTLFAVILGAHGVLGCAAVGILASDGAFVGAAVNGVLMLLSIIIGSFALRNRNNALLYSYIGVASLWALFGLGHIFFLMNIIKGSGNMIVGNTISNFYQESSSVPVTTTIPVTTSAALPTTTTARLTTSRPVETAFTMPPPRTTAAPVEPTVSEPAAEPVVDPGQSPTEVPPETSPPVEQPASSETPAPTEQPTESPSETPAEGSLRRRDVGRFGMERRALVKRQGTFTTQSVPSSSSSSSTASGAPFIVNIAPAITGLNMLVLGVGIVASLYLPITKEDTHQPGKFDSNNRLNNNTMSTTKSAYEEAYEMKLKTQATPPPDYNNNTPLSPSNRTMALLEGSDPDAPKSARPQQPADMPYPPFSNPTNTSANRPYNNVGPAPNSNRWDDDPRNPYPTNTSGPRDMDMYGANPSVPRMMPGAGPAPRLYGDDESDMGQRNYGNSKMNMRSRDTLYTVAGGDDSYSDMASEPSLGRNRNNPGRFDNAPPMPSPAARPPPQAAPPRNHQQQRPPQSFDRPGYGGGGDWEESDYGRPAPQETGSNPRYPESDYGRPAPQETGPNPRYPESDYGRPAPQETGSNPRYPDSNPRYPDSNPRYPDSNPRYADSNPRQPQDASRRQPPPQANGSMKKEPKVRCKTCGEKMFISQSSSHVCAGADAGNAASAPQPVAQAPPQAKRDGRPAPGKRMRVVKRYVPKLDDEVYLEVGDTVEIEDVFEDGWGCGVNITSSESGAFPLSTLDSNNRSAKQRVQSMYFGGRGGPNEAPEDDLR